MDVIPALNVWIPRLHLMTRDTVDKPVESGAIFLGATKHLYNWLCPSVCLSVCGVTHSFDDPHVASYWPTWPCFFLW